MDCSKEQDKYISADEAVRQMRQAAMPHIIAEERLRAQHRATQARPQAENASKGRFSQYYRFQTHHPHLLGMESELDRLERWIITGEDISDEDVEDVFSLMPEVIRGMMQLKRKDCTAEDFESMQEMEENLVHAAHSLGLDPPRTSTATGAPTSKSELLERMEQWAANFSRIVVENRRRLRGKEDSEKQDTGAAHEATSTDADHTKCQEEGGKASAKIQSLEKEVEKLRQEVKKPQEMKKYREEMKKACEELKRQQGEMKKEKKSRIGRTLDVKKFLSKATAVVSRFSFRRAAAKR